MPTLFGATEVPLVAEADGDDKLLSHTVSFLQAVGNAYAMREFRNVSPQERPPIESTFTHDPNIVRLADNKLPALFLYRGEVQAVVDVAQDIRVEQGTLQLVYIPRRTTTSNEAVRFRFAAKLFKVFDVYLERGHDPAWKVPGDPALNVDSIGSVLARFAKFRRLRIGRASVRPITFEVEGADPVSFYAYSAECPYEEQVTPAPDRYDELDGVNVNIFAPAEPPALPDDRLLIEQQLTT